MFIKIAAPCAPLLLLLFTLSTAACGGAVLSSAPAQGAGPAVPNPSPPTTLQGGVLVTLIDAGETFHVWVTHADSAQRLADIAKGSLSFTNITGRLRSGAGAGQHNKPWGWHLDPASILVNIHTFAPVYSGTPSQVEADLTQLLAKNSDKMTSGAASLVSVEDKRGP